MKEQKAINIVQKLRSAGHAAYFAGGSVRDRALGLVPKDFDIATSANPEEIQRLFQRTVPVGVQFGVILVIDGDDCFEVATFRTEGSYKDGRRPDNVQFTTLEEDVRRRDFTVNGLYWDPIEKKVIDQIGGLQDLKDKRIRCIGDPKKRFLEDHLRMLRAVRFSVQLGFEIDPPILDVIREENALIQKISWERIREEMTKLLTSPDPHRGIVLLDQLGLLQWILPEVLTMKGVEQPAQYHPEGDVYVHTLLLMKQLSNPSIELSLACLLHDIAKPATFERATDRIRFHGHDRIGAEMTYKILKRLTYSNDLIDLVCELVREHLKFKDVFQMKQSTLKRFFALPRFDLHMELHRIDCLASHAILDAYKFCQEKLVEFSKLPPPPTRLITGKDLLTLGYKSGPRLGEILHEIEDAILEGEISTKEQALEFVKTKYQP